MRFGVLGTVTVTGADGCPIQVTSEKQRTLLAILLARPGQSLSADRLVDLIWPIGPPPSARPNVQVYVHRLRRLLGTDVIAHDDVGYRLSIAPGDVDAARFEMLARTGAEQVAVHDNESARATFDDALSLWRGPPYSGVSSIETLRVEADRLDEMHLAVLGGRYEALIRLGQSAQVVSDLRAAIADHPWHERFRGQVMRALYAVGRGADALASYHEARTLFVHELGIEPGVELRRIEHAILTDDTATLEIGNASTVSPTVHAPAHASDPAAAASHRVEPDTDSYPPEAGPGSQSGPGDDGGDALARPVLAPGELPAPDPAFSGRADLIEDISRRLVNEPGRVVVLHGRGGAGKSTLALRVAEQCAHHYPDGQVYVDMHGATPGRDPLPSIAAIARCLRSLGFGDREIPRDIDEAAALLRSAMAGRRLLLVFDDVRDAAQVRPILPGATGRSSVMVTSRIAMPTLGTDHVAVGVLDSADAIELLARVVGSDRVAGEPEPAADIVDLCDRLALAVRIAAARLVARTDWTLSTMAARLADERHRLDELESDDLTVRSSCAISVEALSDEAARLFQYLGVLDLATVSAPVAAALVHRSVPAAERLLDQLVEVHLADPSGGPRRVLHDLIRLYARDLAEEHLSPDERQETIIRVGHHYVLAARAASVPSGTMTPRRRAAGIATADLSGTAPSITDEAAVGQWARHETANISSVAWLLASTDASGRPVLVALATAVVEPFGSLGMWSDAAAVNEVALTTADQADDPAALAAVHDNLGHIYAHLQRPSASTLHYESALRWCEQIGDRAGALSAQIGLGYAALRSERTVDAHDHLTTALKLAETQCDPRSESMARNGLGTVLVADGRYDHAVAMYERALGLTDGTDEGGWHSTVWVNLGAAHRAAGRMVEAINAFERASELSRSRGHAVQLARGLWFLADILRDVEEDADAHARRQESLIMLRELDLISDADVTSLSAQPRPTPPGVLATG